MTQPFRTLPRSGPFTLANLRVPPCLLGEPGVLKTISITIADGLIVQECAGIVIDMAGAMVLPAFTDMHTHLDKGHIWGRAPNPDGTFETALATAAVDRTARWTAEDVRSRMEFALRCAYAHGTRAIRTHLDTIPPQDGITWPVFRELRADWAGRIDLQAACLASIEHVSADGPYRHTADIVAESGGVLGAVAYPLPDLDARLDTFFRLARERGLDADFHADETQDASSASLRAIAEANLRSGFGGRVTVGHCCSLARQTPEQVDRTLDMVAEAGLAIVSLPMCNLYLQDRQPGVTPRFRGPTLVHEMRARGIPVAFASDNTRDPFYAYGDLDMIEVMREATRICHLDHAGADWPRAFSEVPASICGFESPSLLPGSRANMVICRARSWTELHARPQSDRIVLREGTAIDTTLPDYSELDHLMET
jgi:cytosine/creatinine deaminase